MKTINPCSFFYSAERPFWTLNNNNYPNKEIFANFDDRMIPDKNLKINEIDIFRGEIICKNSNIKYIKIMEDSVHTKYYYVNKTDFILSQGVYRYQVILDIYATYTIQFLTTNETKKLSFLRTHDWNNEILQIQDNILYSFPKILESTTFKKSVFNHDKENDIWYNNELGLKANQDDLLNANKYYVFKDGINGGYTFFPILSKTSATTIFKAIKIPDPNSKQELFFENGSYKRWKEKRVEVRNFTGEQVKLIQEAYSNGGVVEYWTQRVIDDLLSTTLTPYDTKLKTKYGTFPKDVSVNIDQYVQTAGFAASNHEISILGTTDYKYWIDGITMPNYNQTWDNLKKAFRIKCIIYTKYLENSWTKYEVNNSIVELEKLRATEKYANKFLGIFYLPHLLNWRDTFIEDGKIQLVFDPRGANLEQFKIMSYESLNIEGLNNTYSAYPYLYNFSKVKYYNNEINIAFRLNDSNAIYLSGLSIFANSGTIIAKNNDLIPLSESIINYPFMLPIGVDNYINYVLANRGTTDTGMDIKRQEASNAIGGAIGGAFMGVASAGMSAASGNVAGAAMSGIKAIGGAATGIMGQLNGLKNQEAQIRNQYENVKNTTGNSINMSSTIDASFLNYYDNQSEIGEQFEGVEIQTLTPNTMALLNNYIYLNGYSYPHFSNFKEKIYNERPFNFIQLDSLLIEENINFLVDYEITPDILEMIKNQLTAGLRIWNQKEATLPDIDDVPVPDIPDPDRPIIPPPPPPPPPEPPHGVRLYEHVEITHWNNPMPVTFFDNTGTIREGKCFILINSDYEIVQPNVLLGDQQNEIIKFRELDYLTWSDRSNVINFIFCGKSGGNKILKIKLAYHWEIIDKIILKDFTSTDPISNYTDNLINVTPFSHIEFYDLDNKLIKEVYFT